ncbi:MAG: cytochrome c3 family protein [Coriobacteriales bacterium]|nr:cytochrome c3 family protein [Coriobacteriales bacterium]
MDCSHCHSVEADSLVDVSRKISTNHSGIGCTTCHADIDPLQLAHTEVTADSTDAIVRVLDKTQIDEDSCSACHNISELAELTASVDVLTDSKGLTVNPHQLPTVGTHESIMCGRCHDMHSAGNPLVDAPEYCLSCHHADVYECNTCHEG